MVRSNAQRKKNSEDIDALHSQIYGGDPIANPPTDDNIDPPAATVVAEADQEGERPNPDATVELVPETAKTVETDAGEPDPDNAGETGNPSDWQQKYDSLQGKYNAELPKLQQELKATQDMLQTLGQQQTELPDFSESALTAEEIDEYGEELIDIINRSAQSQIAPVVAQLQKQNAELQERLQLTAQSTAATSRKQLMLDLNSQVPDWETQNIDKNFVDWLGQPDLYSGSPRQNLLVQAFEANDSNRVIAFFKGYKQEQTGQPAPPPAIGEAQPPRKGNGLETLVAPGRPAGTAAAGAQKSGRIFSAAELEAYTKAKQQRKYSDEDVLRFDAEIHRAAMEGRIQN